MNALAEIKTRFRAAVKTIANTDPEPFMDMIRPAQDDRFGDYQVNCAMSLGKKLGQSPRDVATQILEHVDLSGFCSNAEVAGPGFINLTIDDDWLQSKLTSALVDEQLGVERADPAKTVVVDFSSPNVAKPMHVGHIRSTVIGDALSRILKFAGHQVVTDNHLGDWGTQFGMIIYGYKNFVDDSAFEASPIDELLRLYRKVRQIIDFHKSKDETLPRLTDEIGRLEQKLSELEALDEPAEKPAAKKHRKDLASVRRKIGEVNEAIDSAKTQIAEVEADSDQLAIFNEHQNIGQAVLQETANLHAGDQTNYGLWEKFLPICKQDIQKIYDRLNINFDYELGESYYHDRLAEVVSSLTEKSLAQKSEGATCVFVDEFETPMIVQKRDGAFLYATTDLATIQYRMEKWSPDVSLYVVDHRQHEHFAKLFAVARKWGFDQTDLRHISFGTILGADGKPFKTRSGDTVGLEGLLDTAVEKAQQLVGELDDNKPDGPQLDEEARREVAECIGIGALKYADLSQLRTSDYTFSYEKMVNLKGNTAPYLQYSYARVQGIYRKGKIDPQELVSNPQPFEYAEPLERKLAIQVARFGEAIDEVLIDYKPNLLANYLYDLTETYHSFFSQIRVLDAPSESLKLSRLQLCELVGRCIKTGLQLLGIGVVEKM